MMVLTYAFTFGNKWDHNWLALHRLAHQAIEHVYHEYLIFITSLD